MTKAKKAQCVNQSLPAGHPRIPDTINTTAETDKDDTQQASAGNPQGQMTPRIIDVTKSSPQAKPRYKRMKLKLSSEELDNISGTTFTTTSAPPRARGRPKKKPKASVQSKNRRGRPPKKNCFAVSVKEKGKAVAQPDPDATDSDDPDATDSEDNISGVFRSSAQDASSSRPGETACPHPHRWAKLKNSTDGRKPRKPCFVCKELDMNFSMIAPTKPGDPKRKQYRRYSKGCKTCGVLLCEDHFAVFHTTYNKKPKAKDLIPESKWAPGVPCLPCSAAESQPEPLTNILESHKWGKLKTSHKHKRWPCFVCKELDMNFSMIAPTKPGGPKRKQYRRHIQGCKTCKVLLCEGHFIEFHKRFMHLPQAKDRVPDLQWDNDVKHDEACPNEPAEQPCLPSSMMSGSQNEPEIETDGEPARTPYPQSSADLETMISGLHKWSKLKNSKDGRKSCFVCKELDVNFSMIKPAKPGDPKRKHYRKFSKGCKTCGVLLCNDHFVEFHKTYIRMPKAKDLVHHSKWEADVPCNNKGDPTLPANKPALPSSAGESHSGPLNMRSDSHKWGKLKNGKDGRKPCFVCKKLDVNYSMIKPTKPGDPKRKHYRRYSKGCKTCGVLLCENHFEEFHNTYMDIPKEKDLVHASKWEQDGFCNIEEEGGSTNPANRSCLPSSLGEGEQNDSDGWAPSSADEGASTRRLLAKRSYGLVEEERTEPQNDLDGCAPLSADEGKEEQNEPQNDSDDWAPSSADEGTSSRRLLAKRSSSTIGKMRTNLEGSTTGSSFVQLRAKRKLPRRPSKIPCPLSSAAESETEPDTITLESHKWAQLKSTQDGRRPCFVCKKLDMNFSMIAPTKPGDPKRKHYRRYSKGCKKCGVLLCEDHFVEFHRKYMHVPQAKDLVPEAKWASNIRCKKDDDEGCSSRSAKRPCLPSSTGEDQVKPAIKSKHAVVLPCSSGENQTDLETMLLESHKWGKLKSSKDGRKHCFVCKELDMNFSMIAPTRPGGPKRKQYRRYSKGCKTCGVLLCDDHFVEFHKTYMHMPEAKDAAVPPIKWFSTKELGTNSHQEKPSDCV